MPSRYPSSFLDELRSRTDIIQLISGYVSLKKNGRKYWGLCPFHGEKTASFSVDPEHQLYYCFGCKAGGSAIGFTMEIERMDFNEAVAFLAERARMPLPNLESSEEYEKRKSQRERLLEANKQAARFYHQTLFSPDGAASLEYLRKRGLSDAVIRKFGLGAAPNAWDKLTTCLTEQGFTEEELQLAGLTVIKSAEPATDGYAGRPRRAFDMFRNRAIFPIIDQYGNVLAFGGRALGDQQPKYLNTSDTPVFNKRKGVYAANLLRKERHLERVILVEGYMDVVSLTQFGVTGVCATLGTALTNEQARLLRKFAPCVYLGYDGDSAGQHAILRGLDIMAEENIPARVLDFPDRLDPDEFIRRDGPEAFSRLPAISPETYRIRRLKDENDLSTRDGKVAFAKAAAVIISGLDPVEREGYIEDLCVQTGFSREVLLEQIGLTVVSKTTADSSVKNDKRTVRKNISEAASEEINAQEILLGLIATGHLPEDIVTEEDFEDQELKLIYASLKAGHSIPSIIDQAPDEASRSRYARVLTSPVVESTDEMIIMANDCINSLRRKSLEQRLKKLQSEISTCRDSSTKSNLLSQYQELQTSLNKLKPYSDERVIR